MTIVNKKEAESRFFKEKTSYQSNAEWSGTDLIYFGWSPPGTATDEAGWNIVKFTYDGSGNFLSKRYANNNLDMNKIWDDRATYTY